MFMNENYILIEPDMETINDESLKIKLIQVG